MNDSVRTLFKSRNPWILLEIMDGRFEVIQFEQKIDHEQDGEFITTLRVALTKSLAQHEADVLESMNRSPAGPIDPDREAALGFARKVLEEAAGTPPASKTWFPERADGRDPSGAVHVSIVRSEVVVLDVPSDMWQDPQCCSSAIRDALNQALERHDKDVVEFGIRRNGGQQPTTEPVEPDWAMLAKQANRLRNGWC